ncbi:hypothetical protein EVAR_10170_1 [Eumeta japonica]|uniref:Peptidase A2 domain-containing protein n=1 Tax=Eumeta variegata TaxID=151549 RepID=A0A4C1TGR2_EUMVA|nr:hypothetical protein EVAR_10170_1 [Eumeta japonica]
MKREEGRREAKLIVPADFLEREAELAAVYARPPPRIRSARPSISSPRDAFKALNSDEKWDFVKREKLCFKCITKTHPRAYCRAKGCAKCNRGHHTLLHPSTGSDARPARAAHPNESAVSETVTNIGTGESKALLKIVPVTIRAADREIKVHALLDDGATVTLLDDSVASHINAKGPRAELKLISARGHQISDRNSRRIKIKVRGPNGVERDIQCRTITRLDLPSQSLTADEISSHHHLNECHLEALRDARPLLLIGQDNWELITGSDVRRGKSGEPVASLTGLGWVVHGRRKTVDEYREQDGPRPAFAAAYTAQIEKLIENGYARRLENRAQVRDCFFLPHFAVTNPNKPNKIRVVFDAAARFEGKSLNDYLLSGPDLLNSLTGILFRFRIGSVAFTGDIRDMFLRVRVCAPDQRAQLFLWRGADRDSEPRVYAMTSLIFGASSSPTSAIYVLNKNAETCSDEYPNAEMAVKRDHYVDDFICSTDSVPEAAKLISDVTIVHARGGFDIRGWATNAPELKESLSAESSAEAATVSLHKTKTERALGLIWEPECDSLGSDVTFKKLPRDIVNGKISLRKGNFEPDHVDLRPARSSVP